MFNQLANVEKNHLSTIEQMEKGTVLTQNSSSAMTIQSFTPTYSMGDTPEKTADCFLCSDLLTIEKHASHLYDTCIFEFKDDNMRNTLNAIQKQEQTHGKMIYDYMQTNSMYS